MLQRFLIVLTVMVVGSGCTATQKQPEFQFPAGTRVGIVNHLESYATHQNFNELRFGSFLKKYDVDWDIPTYVQNRLTRILNKDPRYSVIALETTERLGKAEFNDQPAQAHAVEPEVADILEKLAGQNDLDVIVFIKSHRGPSPFKLAKHPIQLQGYGLFTREFLMVKNAYAYANIEVMVLKTHPLTPIGSGQPDTQDFPLRNLNLSGELKNLPLAEFNKLRPLIQKYADDAVIKALDSANLVSSR